MIKYYRILRLLLVGLIGYCLAGSRLYGQTYTMPGSTTAIGGDCYRITQDKAWQSGAVWYTDTLNIAASFDIEFTLNFGVNDKEGADGLVFVMQTVGNQALGTKGHGLGFEDFWPSLGIEFDTHENRLESNDPAFDHIAVLRDGNIWHMGTRNLAGPVQASASHENVEDGKDHLVRLVWNAPRQMLDVYFDCERRLSVRIDMQSIFGSRKEVWWGFTGGTGALSNNQVVCLRKDIVVKDQYEVCKGEAVQLLARPSANGKYSWSPAAWLDNPDSQKPVARVLTDQLFTVNYLDKCNRPIRDSVLVRVAAPFTVDLGEKRTVCHDEPVLLSPQVSTASQPLQYRWSTGETGATLTAAASGTYSVTVLSGSCEAADTVEVDFQPVGFVDQLTVVPEFCFRGEPLQLTASLYQPGNHYVWSHSGANAASTWVYEPGSYELVTTNAFGCQFRERFEVSNLCGLSFWVPEAFSPNADGTNDRLIPYSSQALDLHWTIYDRWGNVIYYSHGADQGWDGNYKGQMCPLGPYPWKAEYRPLNKSDSTYFLKRGVVWIIR